MHYFFRLIEFYFLSEIRTILPPYRGPELFGPGTFNGTLSSFRYRFCIILIPFLRWLRINYAIFISFRWFIYRLVRAHLQNVSCTLHSQEDYQSFPFSSVQAILYLQVARHQDRFSLPLDYRSSAATSL